MNTIELDGAFNVRDLGGLATEDGRHVHTGLVFRADALGSLSLADRTLLFQELGIGTIIDLRTREEAGGDGQENARLFPEVTTYNLSLLSEGRIGREPFPNGDFRRLAHTYLENLSHGRSAAVRTLQVIADSVGQGRPALFHCAAGRDRTGLIAAVLLTLVGVREDQIVFDYLTSNVHAHHVTKRLRENPLYSHDLDPGRPLLLLRPETMQEFLNLLRSRLGGAEAWALDAGVGEETIAVLRDTLLTATPATAGELPTAAAPR